MNAKKSISYMNLFLIFLSFSISQPDFLVCDAPTKFAPKPEGYTLYSQITYLRHGMRTPMNSWFSKGQSGYWICDDNYAESPPIFLGRGLNNVTRRYHQVLNPRYTEFPLNCRPGDLIVRGMHQHALLGQAFRKHLIDDYHFLSDNYNSSEIEVTAGTIERTQRSAISFLSNLYPPQTQNEEIVMTTGSDTLEFLYPDQTECAELNETWNEFILTDTFKSRQQDAYNLYYYLFEKYNITWDTSTWMFLGDILASFSCNDIELPDDTITDEIFNQSFKNMAFFSYGWYGLKKGVAASPIFRHMLNGLLSQLNGSSSVKFRLVSGHDSTIIAFLTSFGYYDDYVPPFASHLDVEIWEKDEEKFVRLCLNGEVIIPPDLQYKDGLIPWEDFFAKCTEYSHFCLEFKKTF